MRTEMKNEGGPVRKKMTVLSDDPEVGKLEVPVVGTILDYRRIEPKQVSLGPSTLLWVDRHPRCATDADGHVEGSVRPFDPRRVQPRSNALAELAGSVEVGVRQ